MVKRAYTKLAVSELCVDIEGSILRSSVTTVTKVPITIPEENVSVEEYQPGFEDSGNDFKDISF